MPGLPLPLIGGYGGVTHGTIEARTVVAPRAVPRPVIRRYVLPPHPPPKQPPDTHPPGTTIPSVPTGVSAPVVPERWLRRRDGRTLPLRVRPGRPKVAVTRADPEEEEELVITLIVKEKW